MNKYVLSYMSPSTEGDWWKVAEIEAPSRRKAVKAAKASRSYIFQTVMIRQWRMRRSDK